MLSKICHKLQKHKFICEIHGNNLIEKIYKELIKDWLGNHYCKELLLKFANPVLTKIYYMGVAEHDLASNYQKAHD
jgi:hypothetical protein